MVVRGNGRQLCRAGSTGAQGRCRACQAFSHEEVLHQAHGGIQGGGPVPHDLDVILSVEDVQELLDHDLFGYFQGGPLLLL